MDQVLQVTSDLGANMATFGSEVDASLAFIGPATVIDFSLTAHAGVFTAAISYRLGGLPVRAVGAHSTDLANPSWLQIDTFLQASPGRYGVFIRSVPPEDDRDLPPRQLMCLYSIGTPGILPGNSTVLFAAQALENIAAGASGEAQMLNAFGGVGATVAVRNEGTVPWNINTRAYVFLDANGVWSAFPRCC